jgi:glycosyltransferase involved in cell wall biosynthesis
MGSTALMEARLRIALCFGTYPPERNGGSEFVAHLSHELTCAGADVLVITSASDQPGLRDEAPGLHIFRGVEDWRATSSEHPSRADAEAALREHGSQLLHVLFPDSVHVEDYRLPAVLGLRHIPLVTTFWSLGLGRRSPLAVRAQSLALLGRSAIVTSHDPYYLANLRRLVGWRTPVHWLPVGMNLHLDPATPSNTNLRRRLGLDLNAEYLAFFGQLDWTRGVEDLFVALRALRRERDVRLLMIGSAGRAERYASQETSQKALQSALALPDKLGIAESVVWTAYLADAEVADYLRTADCCVLPYRRNSIGRSALATVLNLGLPTVLGGTPATIEPLKPGVHVEVVPPCDPDAIIGAIRRLLDDAEHRGRLSEGAGRAAALFAWPRIASGALGCYRQALRV